MPLSTYLRNAKDERLSPLISQATPYFSDKLRPVASPAPWHTFTKKALTGRTRMIGIRIHRHALLYKICALMMLLCINVFPNSMQPDHFQLQYAPRIIHKMRALSFFDIIGYHRISSATVGIYSLIGKTSYRKISCSLKAARVGIAMTVSLYNLTSISAALLPSYLSNFRAIKKFKAPNIRALSLHEILW